MVKSRFNLYNPFDEMIMEDPAYAADAMDFQAVQPVAPLNVNVNAPYRAGQTYQEIISRPEVQEQIEQGSQTMADIARGPINFVGDVFAQTLGRIAENMVNEEAAQRGRERFSNQKEAAGMFGKLFSQLTPDEIQFYEQRTGKSTQRPSSLAEDFTENFNFTLDVLLRDAIDGSKAIQDGARFTELPGNQQLGIFLLPLEFWLGGGGARRAGQEIGESLVQKYKDMPLGELVVNPQAQQEIPEVIAQIQREYPILVTSRPRQLETTEDFSLKPQSDMDLSLSQMEAADQRSKRFLTGKSDDEYTTQQLAPERPKVEVKESLKKELEEPNLSNDKKIVKAVIEELDEGKKYADDAEFVKAIENKTGIKDLSVRKISLAKDKQVSQKRLKIPFTLRDPKVGIIGKYRPTQTDNFKKVVEDIEARKGTINAVKPGELTKIARDNDINVDRLREKFPELVVTGRPTRETLEASAVSRRQASLNKVNQMIAFKRQYALKNLLNPDEIPFEEIVQAMKAAGLKPLEGKKLKQYLKSGEITQQQFKNLIPRSQMFKETKPSTGDKIQDIIDGPGSEYQKATDIVTKFGFTVDSGNPVFAKYLANSARKDLPGFVEEMRRAGAMTADEFAQSDELATGLYKNRAEYNQTILDELLNSRMNDDLARGEEPNIPLFNFTENARQGAMNEVDAFLRKTFLEETNDKKLLKMRDAFLKEYGGTLKRKIDLSTQRGQDAFIRNLKKIFGPQLAHTAPVGGQLSSKVIADFADNIRINPAAYNVQLQVRVERGIQTHFRKLKKALKDGNKKEIKDLIKVLKNYDKVFKKRI